MRFLARVLLNLFYRGIEIVGLPRLPAAGPVVLCANHHNALVDPMLLIACLPRRLRGIAKSTLFRHRILGPWIRLAGSISVERPQDRGSQVWRNVEMFRAATRALRDGEIVLIFPEGVSQPEPALQPLRTGAARLWLTASAENPGPPPAIVPVGMTYDRPATFRGGRALMLIGDPIPAGDLADLYRQAPDEAVTRLTRRIGEALQRQFVEAGDRETLRLLRLAEALRREEGEAPAPEARAAWMQVAMRVFKDLAANDPARAAALRERLDGYARDLESAGLSPELLSRAYPATVVLRYALAEGIPILVGLPLAACGIALNAPGYALTAIAVRAMRPEPDAEATTKIVAAFFLYPGAWLVEAWIAWRAGGGRALALFAVLSVAAGFFALAWRERFRRFRREARGFFLFLFRRDLHARLRERRGRIAADLDALRPDESRPDAAHARTGA